MDYSLYIKNNNYYLITNKAINYNIVLEFKTFNNKLISNEELSQLNLIEFNKNNIELLLKDFIIDLTDFDYYNYIKFNNNIYRFNNWLDVFKFAAERY